MSWILPVLRGLHILSAVFWVGGMFFAYLVLRPSLLVLEPNQRMLVHTQVFRRFFRVVWHAMPLSIATGLAMVFFVFGGMAFVPPRVHVMLALGLLMGAIFVYIYFGPYKRFQRTTDKTNMAASLDTIRKLIAVNLGIGVVTIVFGSIG